MSGAAAGRSMAGDATRGRRRRRDRAVLAALALTCLAVPGTVRAQAPPVAADGSGEVAARLDAAPTRLTVGDPVTLTLTVRHPAAVQVVPPRLGPTWGDFEVRAQAPATTTTLADGSLETVQHYAAAVFAVGRFQTPPLDVIAVDAGGDAFHVSAPPAAVEVASVIRGDDDGPRDIKPQASLPPPPRWPLALAGGAAAVLVAGAAWRARRRPAPAPLPEAAVDVRSPVEIARGALAEVARAGWLDRGEVKLHYTLVTDCVRRYIEAAVGVPALEATTRELRPALGAAGLGPVTAAATLRLLDDADLVKFARWHPPADAAGRLVGEALAIVEAIDRETAGRDAGAPRAEGHGAAADAAADAAGGVEAPAPALRPMPEAGESLGTDHRADRGGAA